MHFSKKFFGGQEETNLPRLSSSPISSRRLSSSPPKTTESQEDQSTLSTSLRTRSISMSNHSHTIPPAGPIPRRNSLFTRLGWNSWSTAVPTKEGTDLHRSSTVAGIVSLDKNDDEIRGEVRIHAENSGSQTKLINTSDPSPSVERKFFQVIIPCNINATSHKLDGSYINSDEETISSNLKNVKITNNANDPLTHQQSIQNANVTLSTEPKSNESDPLQEDFVTLSNPSSPSLPHSPPTSSPSSPSMTDSQEFKTITLHYPISVRLDEIMQFLCKEKGLAKSLREYSFILLNSEYEKPLPLYLTLREVFELNQQHHRDKGLIKGPRYLLLTVKPNTDYSPSLSESNHSHPLLGLNALHNDKDLNLNYHSRHHKTDPDSIKDDDIGGTSFALVHRHSDSDIMSNYASPPQGINTGEATIHATNYANKFVEHYIPANTPKSYSMKVLSRPFAFLEGEEITLKIKQASFLQKTAENNFILPRGTVFITNFRIVYKSRLDTDTVTSTTSNGNLSSPQLTGSESGSVVILSDSSNPGGSSSNNNNNNMSNSNSGFLSTLNPLGAPNTTTKTSIRNNNIVQDSVTEIHIPLFMIMSLFRKPLPGHLLGQQDQIKLRCRDMREYKVTLSSSKADVLWNRLDAFVNPMSHPTLSLTDKIFAFQYKWRSHTEYDGWSVYHPKGEFRRMNIPNSQWSVVDWNSDYEMIPTYPSELCIPSAMSYKEIREVVSFRSKGRIPALCWKNPDGNQTITRGSQPYVGLMGRTCAEDQKLIKEIYQTNVRTGGYLRIVDARPKVNAVGNKAKGFGYEYNTNHCRIQFMGIDNIHVMRDSLSKVFDLINRDNLADNSWLSNLEATNWMRHLKIILESAVQVVQIIQEGDSVLIHCSDGWDRTAQLSSLAQLMLDPYYRTIEGIQVLIEKDWLSFGHRFANRCGQDGKDSESSPIFFQWIDCVSQLLHQFPCSFEFNSRFLITLADEVYSCRFGTFLFNSEAERVHYQVSKKTVSLWTYMNSHRENFINNFYQRNPNVITPTTLIRKLQFWEDFYFRYDNIYNCNISFGFTGSSGTQHYNYYGVETSKKREDIQQAAVENFQMLQLKLNALHGKAPDKLNWKDVVRLLQAEKTAKKQAIKLEVSQIIEEMINAVFDNETEKRLRHVRTGSIASSSFRLSTDELVYYRPSWIPDQWSHQCAQCEKSFSSMRRKHHCRACGHVFCGNCTARKIPIPRYMYYDPVRVCDGCFEKLEDSVRTGLP